LHKFAVASIEFAARCFDRLQIVEQRLPYELIALASDRAAYGGEE
jgi:hypothetical protein